MLTSFFGNSRPVNFLILGGFILIGYTFGVLWETDSQISPSTIFYHVFFAALSVLSMMLLDFVITKNKLTKPNTLAVLFFSCFLVMLPVIFQYENIILANLFLLLAFRRVISLRKDTNSTKKILDASVWITIASLFYFWSIIFFIPLWIAIIQKPNTNYKQVLVPFMGFIAVMIITASFKLLVGESFTWFLNWKQPIGLDFSVYNSAQILIPSTIIFGFYIWAGIFQILKLSSLSFKDRPNHLLLLYISAATFLIALAAPEKTGAELLFILAPVAIIVTNYFENVFTRGLGPKDAFDFWFKEILIWLIVIMAFFFLLT